MRFMTKRTPLSFNVLIVQCYIRVRKGLGSHALLVRSAVYATKSEHRVGRIPDYKRLIHASIEKRRLARSKSASVGDDGNRTMRFTHRVEEDRHPLFSEEKTADGTAVSRRKSSG
jgi:hypothetical protein